MAARDIGLILGQRMWQGAAGLVTILFVARFLSPEEQGWYYTFVSVAAFYSVFEMGLSAAVMQTSAHLFVSLRWQPGGSVEGAAAGRFACFLARAVRVYLLFAIAFFVAIAIFGLAYFQTKAANDAVAGSWTVPWLVLVLVTAANMMTLPLLSAVEGSGRIAEVYGVRLAQGVVGSLACWAVIGGGGALWAAVAMPAMGLLVAAFWVFGWRPRTLAIAFVRPEAGGFDWRCEVWPLQWRIGVSWIGAYLMSQLATPILFYFQDAVVAGQMGLSLTVAHMVGLMAQSALARNVPPMSRAVAGRNWREYGRIFRKALLQFVAIFTLGGVLVGAAYVLLADTAYANRVLPAWQLAGLVAFAFFYQLNAAFATHLRSFRREPLAWISAIGAVLVVSGSIGVAARYSVSGVILAMLSVQAGLVFPLSFLVWRQRVAAWCRD